MLYLCAIRRNKISMTLGIVDQLVSADIVRFGTKPAEAFANNIRAVNARIAETCHRCGRKRDEVRLLPVTKTVPAQILRFAFEAGIRDFGENKVQEAESKRAELLDLDIRWSLIGHLQTNKAKHIVRFASEFHALDSLRLANELNCRSEALDRDLDIFVQVNTSQEHSKYGLHPDEVIPFIERLGEFPRLKPRGLMTLAVLSLDVERIRRCFRTLRRLRDQSVVVDNGISLLSMGMSSDYEIAIEEGANILRVGRAIFGPRPATAGPYWPSFRPVS